MKDSRHDEMIIDQTKKWICDVVIGCHFCPFAAKVYKEDGIHYLVLPSKSFEEVLQELNNGFLFLDRNKKIETFFLILPESFLLFKEYLLLVDLSESLLKKQGYVGIYQIASFHPSYLFAGSTESDPENYTNRSPYPMLHLLREDSVTAAIEAFPGTEKIPERNIQYARQKGIAYMQRLRKNCIDNYKSI